MLVNLARVLPEAVEAGYGVACFNVFGFEDARAVVEAAEELGAPVILAASLDFTRFMPVEAIAAMFRSLAERAAVPVVAHLDHTYEFEPIFRAIDAGFTSVMFDGSPLPLAANIAGCRRIAAYARPRGVSVEAEIGSVPYAEGRDHIRAELTDVREAQLLAEQGDIDALAVSIGNIHRLKAPGAVIDFARLAEIEAAVNLPLVIHGTSGIRDADLARLARARVAKFNVGTSLRQSFGRALRQALAADTSRFDRLTIMQEVIPVMKAEASRVIRLLGWPGPAAGASC